MEKEFSIENPVFDYIEMKKIFAKVKRVNPDCNKNVAELFQTPND